MELNIGDYVRILTLSGISKIEKLEKIDDICITDNGAADRNNIIKSSPNIIDLIEVGDYVNGMPVLHKENDELICGLLLRYKEENIENIVTKEQFEAMKYKIGDDK